jgi:GNAT superfamily N-acetyltransferase
VVAPPYRRHGLAAALLDTVVADAPARGARWIEAYPINEERPDDAGRFRGPRALFEARGFHAVKTRALDTVVRRAVPG